MQQELQKGRSGATESSRRILLVEDEQGLRMVVESELARAGYSVEVLGNGLDAIARLSKERFDLAILDVALPGKSGLEVLQFIRDRQMRTRVIMITGIEGLSAAIKAMKRGASDYIPTPFDAEYLLSSVKAVLREKR
ncbi:MAG: response regulator [Bacteroidetes bacterium]|nr:response regulator [Bacteroidota bacterium]MCW5895462.1 response regulator [Bacteroidota bacterium]